ncbi:MAG TPA: MarR family transcriptional regulator [Candidatus Cybelea sp.]|nr:MarR family transcriptional regulator [Candidatus Cybelea sp.]
MAPPNDARPPGRDDWLGDEPERPSAAALQPGVGHRIHAVARLIRRRFERRVRQAGLPITRLQASLLIRIARKPGLSQTAAATELDIEPIALVRMLDRLHEEGLVERRAHPTDRRVRTLWLTRLAWPVVQRILEINAVVREEACAGLSPAARGVLMDALDHMKNNLAAAEAAEAAGDSDVSAAAK